MEDKEQLIGSLAYWLAAGKLEPQFVLPAIQKLADDSAAPKSLLDLLEACGGEKDEALNSLGLHLRETLRAQALRLHKARKLGQAAPSDPAAPWADRAAQLLQIHAPKIPIKLGPWLNRPLPLQFCLCDIWNDHVLFEGDEMTGLVDFGGVKLDHVAVDLARLLGSLAEDRAELRAVGLEAYSRIRPLSLEEEQLVFLLDETGVLVGLITWLKWLYVEDKQFDDLASAARRLQALVERVERWRKV